MPTHSLRFAAIAAALLALGTTLSAQGRGPDFGPGHCSERGANRGFRGLNLTEAQQSQMKAIHEKHQAALKNKIEAVDAARKAMHDAMAKAGTDTKALQALHEKVSAAQFDLMLEHRAVQQEILPLLTAEQKVQFEKRAAGMGSRGARGGMGSGPGFGPGHGGMRPDSPRVQPS